MTFRINLERWRIVEVTSKGRIVIEGGFRNADAAEEVMRDIASVWPDARLVIEPEPKK